MPYGHLRDLDSWNERFMNTREIFLWSGCVLGLALILFGVQTRSATMPTPIPDSVAVMVNGSPISKVALNQMVEKDRASPSPLGSEEAILHAMVDEELLIARALELGLLRRTPQVRQHLLSAMGEYIDASTRLSPPQDAELRAYFNQHITRFSGFISYRVRCVFIRGNTEAAKENISKAQEDLAAGRSFEEIEKLYGSTPSMRLPHSALPPAALRMYLGPTAAKIAEDLDPGTWSAPIRVAGGTRIVKLVEIIEPPAPVFEENREKIVDLYSLSRRHEAMKEYLSDLRRQATIRMAPGKLMSPVDNRDETKGKSAN